MTITKLQLYNGALRLVGERRLGTLTEAREPRFLLDDAWDEDAIKSCLEAGQWLFATRTMLLTADEDVTPEFGFRYAFPKPTDWVRTCVVSLDEMQDEPLKRFRDEANVWYADSNVIYVSFISDLEDYGNNWAIWPQSFVKYVQAYLAKEICSKITNSPTSVKELDKQMERILSNAQGKNAINRPPSFPTKGSFVHARGGGQFDRRRSDRY